MVYEKSTQLQRTIDFIKGFEHDYHRYLELKLKKNSAQSDEQFHEYDYRQMEILEDYNNGIFEIAITFKHHAYQREEEMRLLISTEPLDDNITKYKVSSTGLFVEYIPLKLNLPEQLKSVTVHPLNGDLHSNGIDRFISARVGYKRCQ